VPNSLNEKCRHLMHLPSGKCLGCGEQHQPLPDYQPGDDEKWSAEHGAMTDGTNPVIERLRPALKLLDGLEVGQDCEEYAYAKANGLQAMTTIPEAFEALRALPDAIAALEAMPDVVGLREALERQTIMVDRLCSAVDRETQGIGGEGSLTVLGLLGPINDDCLALLGGRAALAKWPAQAPNS
jgi:hypothetical protein